MSEVTYIWGAGASWGERKFGKNGIITEFTRGMPVVNELERAIQLLKVSLAQNAKQNVVAKNQHEYIAQKLDLLGRACNSYPTIDTLAKQLFVTKDKFDNVLSYDDLKRSLAVALLMMQDWKKRDLRYDGFIASLIKEDKSFPPMTILSWNYDVQFELAYSRYLKDKLSIPFLWKELNVYNKKYTFCCDSNKPFEMIKLNGSALFADSSQIIEVGGNRAADIENCFDDDNNETPLQLGYKFLTGNNYSDMISYAWENGGMKELKSAIEQRVSDTNLLIVIGYSFPYVNNDVDTFIIKNMPELENVVIQNKNFDDVKERVEGILEGRHVNIVSKQSLQQFCIPNRF